MNQDYEIDEYLTNLCMDLMDRYGSCLMQTCYAMRQVSQQLQPIVITNGNDRRHQVKFSYYQVPKGEVINVDNLAFNLMVRMEIEPIMVQDQAQLQLMVTFDAYNTEMQHFASSMKQTVTISSKQSSVEHELVNDMMRQMDELAESCLQMLRDDAKC